MAAAAFGMQACRHLTEEPGQPWQTTLNAAIEADPETRTLLTASENGVSNVLWSENDRIAVFIDGDSNLHPFTLSGGAGTRNALFSGEGTGSSYEAFYPVSMSPSIDGKTILVTFPYEQSYVPGTFAPGAFPMAAISGTPDIQFRNVCSVLRLSLAGNDTVTRIVFRSKSSDALVSGRATVSMDDPENPVLKVAGDGCDSLALNVSGVTLKQDIPTDFFLVLPPQTYKGGFTVRIYSDNRFMEKTYSMDFTMERSKLHMADVFDFKPNGLDGDPDDIPYDEIWYVSTSSRIVNLRDGATNSTVVSHSYEGGKGVIKFSGPVTEIRRYGLFNSPYYISEIHLPNSVRSLGESAFSNCRISSFHTPDMLESVGRDCFRSCQYLTDISGKWATADGRGILLEDGSLVAYASSVTTEDFYLPSGVRSVGAALFSGNETIRNLYLPEGLETLGSESFAGCSALETVALPSTLNSIHSSAFTSCYNLREFKGANGLLLDSHTLVSSNGELVGFAGAGVTDYTMPEGVKGVQNEALCGWPELRSITFPSSLYSLQGGWLNDNVNLEFLYGPGTSEDHHCYSKPSDYLVAATSICPADYKIPDDAGVNRIFDYVFYGNPSIERLTVPDDVFYIGTGAFAEMPKLKSIILPASLNDCGSDIFSKDTALDTIWLRSFTPPSFTENPSAHIGHAGLTVYVPIGSENLYKTASGWSAYASYIKGYIYHDLQNPDFYYSTDYSRDGEAVLLQAASEGAGIDLVFMGDAFSDRQIADGTYDTVMNKMVKAFFSEEPYTSLRKMFNIWSIKVVSATEGYEHGGQALDGYFGEGTKVGGSDSKCFNYARKAVSKSKMNEVLVIVAMNAVKYAGTCYMYYPSTGDYGNGSAVAYFPLGTDDSMLAQLVLHEAGGHGFAKLGDEYEYITNGTIPQDKINDMYVNIPHGWWKNVDLTNDTEKVKWSRFLKDERYRYDGLGCYEGGYTYWKGVWRPTLDSIMRHNKGGFNAPSREAIWLRAHKLAYGKEWQYDYEAFVQYDAKNRASSMGSGVKAAGTYSSFVPTHPPVVIMHSWSEAVKDIDGTTAR